MVILKEKMEATANCVGYKKTVFKELLSSKQNKNSNEHSFFFINFFKYSLQKSVSKKLNEEQDRKHSKPNINVVLLY